VASVDRRAFAPEHRRAYLERFVETLEPLLHRREVEAERPVLDVEPRGTDTEHRSAARDDVERADHLGEERGVPIGDAGDQRAEGDPLGAGSEGTEERVGLEHLVLGRAQQRQLIEVVHHHDGVEPAPLAGAGKLLHTREQALGRHVGIREVGDLVAESHPAHHAPAGGRTPSIFART
jgi:hypothetical protein